MGKGRWSQNGHGSDSCSIFPNPPLNAQPLLHKIMVRKIMKIVKIRMDTQMEKGVWSQNGHGRKITNIAKILKGQVFGLFRVVKENVLLGELVPWIWGLLVEAKNDESQQPLRDLKDV